VHRRLKQLLHAMERRESRNAKMFYTTSRLFSRLVGRRNREALRVTMGMIERARKVNPDSSEYATELGHQNLMSGNTTVAMECFRQASRLDQASVTPLHGMIRCQIADGLLEDAEQQMEFLTVIHESIGPSSQSIFLQALLAWRRGHDVTSQVALLDRVLELHYGAYRDSFKSGTATFFNRFVLLDPDFLLELAHEYLQHVNLVVRTGGSGGAVDKAAYAPVLKGLRVLERLVSQMPGLLPALVEMARAHLSMGDVEQAQRLLAEAMRLDAASAECQLLMARVAMAQENYKGAAQNLEQALSNDFAVRSSPIYHLLKAQVLSNQVGAWGQRSEQSGSAVQLTSGYGRATWRRR
jgi:tetratricopeptide repeat protein 21B